MFDAREDIRVTAEEGGRPQADRSSGFGLAGRAPIADAVAGRFTDRGGENLAAASTARLPRPFEHPGPPAGAIDACGHLGSVSEVRRQHAPAEVDRRTQIH
jgi:hypothetical protein